MNIDEQINITRKLTDCSKQIRLEYKRTAFLVLAFKEIYIQAK